MQKKLKSASQIITDWISSPGNIELKPDSVHIWSVHISQNKSNLTYFWDLLSTDEQKKANAFYFSKDKNCSIIARGVLRELLGSYLKIDPKHIEFQYGKNGKPMFGNPENIEFNISHSGDVIIFGFTKNNEIGIDVEYIKQDPELLEIASNFFSDEEVKSLYELDTSERLLGFFNCWTRKESFIKAKGDGLSFPLKEFVVSLSPYKKTALLKTKWDANEKSKWVLESFVPSSGYVGAIAVQGRIKSLHYLKWNPSRLLQV